MRQKLRELKKKANSQKEKIKILFPIKSLTTTKKSLYFNRVVSSNSNNRIIIKYSNGKC